MEVKNDTVTVFFDRADMWINCKEKFASDLLKWPVKTGCFILQKRG